ncbi:MAG: CPBP family intramembrane glutamic endopeptidase [Flavitalea sp.]
MMFGHLRVKSPWSQLGIFLGLFGAGFIILAIISALMVLASGIPQASITSLDWSQPRILNLMKWLQALSSIVLFLLPALFFALITFRGRTFYFLGLRPVANKNMYLLAVIIIMMAMPFVIWLGQVNESIPLPKWMTGLESDAQKQMEAFLKADNTTQVIINVLLIALLPAVSEEICFRGALQRILINISKSPWVGIVFTAILFSALHLQFQGFIPRMFLGIILGALYWYSGSLWTSILAHFIYNGVQVVVVSYAPEYVSKNPQMNILLALVSGIAIAGLFWAYKSWSTATYAKEYETHELNGNNEFIA